MSTHANHDAWLIESSAYFHMTPHREWLCKYEKFNGGEVFLGDDSVTKIIGLGKVKLLLNNGRIKTLPVVLHIPELARNLISMSKLGDVGVQTVFEKETCTVIRGAMVLMRGVWVGTLYKLLGSIYIGDCNNIVVSENQTNVSPTRPIEKTFSSIRGWAILERRVFMLCIVKVWLKVSLNFL